MSVGLEVVLAAVALSGSVEAVDVDRVARALHPWVADADLEGALQRHLADVSEQRGARWVATTASVRRALDRLDPELRNRRTAGVIASGNVWAAEQRHPEHALLPHTVRLAARLVEGFVAPRSVESLDTTDLVEARGAPLTAERLRAQCHGDVPGGGLPGRNYVGAGYDADGNVDLVFLAWVYGPTLAAGGSSLSTAALACRIDAWIHHAWSRAERAEGPRARVALVDQMRSLGRDRTLLEDSRVIAGAAWLEVLTDDRGPHTPQDLVMFLDGRRTAIH